MLLVECPPLLALIYQPFPCNWDFVAGICKILPMGKTRKPNKVKGAMNQINHIINNQLKEIANNTPEADKTQ